VVVRKFNGNFVATSSCQSGMRCGKKSAFNMSSNSCSLTCNCLKCCQKRRRAKLCNFIEHCINPVSCNVNCDDNSKNAMQVKLLNPKSLIMEIDGVVAFDHIENHVGNDIVMDLVTGEIQVLKPGHFVVNWSVVVEGSDSSPSVSFGVSVNSEIKDVETEPISVGRVSGSSLISVIEKGTNICIANTSFDLVQLSRYAPCANLTIFEL